jgi:hypothetical protein
MWSFGVASLKDSLYADVAVGLMRVQAAGWLAWPSV